MLPLCAAACCRNWVINLTFDEYVSGLYEAIVRLSHSEDTDSAGNVIGDYETFEVRQGIDGACIYLDDNCQCRIYENRPRVCREFTCGEVEDRAVIFPWQGL